MACISRYLFYTRYKFCLFLGPNGLPTLLLSESTWALERIAFFTFKNCFSYMYYESWISPSLFCKGANSIVLVHILSQCHGNYPGTRPAGFIPIHGLLFLVHNLLHPRWMPPLFKKPLTHYIIASSYLIKEPMTSIIITIIIQNHKQLESVDEVHVRAAPAPVIVKGSRRMCQLFVV